MTGIDSELQEEKPSLRRSRRSLMWAAYAVFIWSLAYMIPHLYWSLGGTIGLSMVVSSAANLPEWQLINGIASVLLTAAGCLGLALLYLKKRKVQNWLLLIIILGGCSLSISHGMYGMINRILQWAGLIELEGGSFTFSEHAYVLWDLFVFEPWFTIEGILFGRLGWSYLSGPQPRRLWLIFCFLGVLVGLITGLLGVRFA
ncbi:DUF3995 domain-containing protein [Halobacillus salinarum]|uniref:DUF3995 domain-containing protein n=1 Tax=Halobacillus salinarum TaxID=2932257 RepID=A0ABY4EPA2_9BACI|nr:DUF3995 domain-containing protein [Halobacillus salinarum]UOQ45916.1 DUF3995 domain-containing protein [Halobacillus salinarum]